MISAALQIALSLGVPATCAATFVQTESKSEKSWKDPRFAVNDVIDVDQNALQSHYPGMDLPTLTGDEEAYYRGNEFIYRVQLKTMTVIEVVPIGSVLLY
ncbi:hypothetical protein PARPLA_01903 [Rhodobacteraceae bacterium THAF1]|nr:hypothetical protein FIU81_09785 [Palleronia sp. THAF1]VDC24300.1 hypothetical protein PARPLA_01903 [Rhodobacteraceae bacterium THAF1]